jgi:hypothetical protein
VYGLGSRDEGELVAKLARRLLACAVGAGVLQHASHHKGGVFLDQPADIGDCRTARALRRFCIAALERL